LTLIGIGSERKISLTSAGRIITIGEIFQTGIELTIGNNITLVGFADNNDNVIWVENGASFIMLDGSIIRENISSATGVSSAAVVITGGSSFIMNGGLITQNQATASSTTIAAGLYATGIDATITLLNGSIIGNTSFAGDVIASQGLNNFTMSGTATVGTLTLNATATAFRSLTIANDWTGSVTGLNLRGANSMNNVISFWENQKILIGEGVNGTTVSQITLGDFLTNTAGDTQAISDTHQLNDLGVLVVNP
jgi:hypothetical protein